MKPITGFFGRCRDQLSRKYGWRITSTAKRDANTTGRSSHACGRSPNGNDGGVDGAIALLRLAKHFPMQRCFPRKSRRLQAWPRY